MWSVWFYANNTYKRLNSYNTRSEAEAYSRIFKRLIGSAGQTIVCFESLVTSETV